MNGFCCDYAARGTASCAKCKVKLPKDSLRLAKLAPSPYSDGELMKTYYHAKCLFETFEKARATTKVIESYSDIDGFSDLEPSDKDCVKKLIENMAEFRQIKYSSSKAHNKKSKATGCEVALPTLDSNSTSNCPSATNVTGDQLAASEVPFQSFCKLTEEMAKDCTYSGKSDLVSKFLFEEHRLSRHKDVTLVVKLLLPGVVKRVYNVHNKQLLKLISSIFQCDQDEMTNHLDTSGDVSCTVQHFFISSKSARMLHDHSDYEITIAEIDRFLDQLSNMTTEKEQARLLSEIVPKLRPLELKVLTRLIKHDLRMNAGAKPVLDALDARAYEAFQTCRNLEDVVERVMDSRQNNPKMSKQLSIKVSLMTPVLPMLAEACKSVSFAMQRCPNGMLSEIKYDGERVQVHKKGNTFQYFSRSLKPVVAHKVAHVKEYLPKACPSGKDMILDSEVLLVDTKTGQPLPFGTLGVHKKTAFANASVCLFIFDCLLFNDETLVEKPLDYRRNILKENITEIPNKIMLSECTLIKDGETLNEMIMETISAGLEGLVLKDTKSVYEPGKRHWLKVKKDYLQDGAMADSADLVCLGAYYGTGSKGGLMSSFLMCVYDEDTKTWLTVTKVSNGFTDAQLSHVNKALKANVKKISKDASLVPPWLKVKKQLVPDFILTDVKGAPVWEVTGAEFSKAEVHTAGGISIRFPRVTKVREDKSYLEATDFKRLKILVEKSKDSSDISTSSVPSSSSPPSRGAKSVKRHIEEEVNSGGKDEETRERASEALGPFPPKMTKTSNSLKNVFSHLKLYIGDDGFADKDKLSRYFIAFDGEAVEMCQVNSKTFVVCSEEEFKSKKIKSGIRVKQDWVFDCVKAGKLLDHTKYLC